VAVKAARTAGRKTGSGNRQTGSSEPRTFPGSIPLPCERAGRGEIVVRERPSSECPSRSPQATQTIVADTQRRRRPSQESRKSSPSASYVGRGQRRREEALLPPPPWSFPTEAVSVTSPRGASRRLATRGKTEGKRSKTAGRGRNRREEPGGRIPQSTTPETGVPSSAGTISKRPFRVGPRRPQRLDRPGPLADDARPSRALVTAPGDLLMAGVRLEQRRSGLRRELDVEIRAFSARRS